MRIEGRIFLGIAAFCFVMAVVYGFWTAYDATGGIEPVGVVGLTLTGGLCLIAGTYFAFVAGRIDSRPEDEEDAEISDGAGEIGFFSPGSYWPVTLALSAALGGIALAFFYTWAIILAGIAILLSVGGLVFEYHGRPNTE